MDEELIQKLKLFIRSVIVWHDQKQEIEHKMMKAVVNNRVKLPPVVANKRAMIFQM